MLEAIRAEILDKERSLALRSMNMPILEMKTSSQISTKGKTALDQSDSVWNRDGRI